MHAGNEQKVPAHVSLEQAFHVLFSKKVFGRLRMPRGATGMARVLVLGAILCVWEMGTLAEVFQQAKRIGAVFSGGQAESDVPGHHEATVQAARGVADSLH